MNADAAEIRARATEVLARREHSRRELEQKLLRRGFDEPVVHGVLNELERANLLSDARFASAYVDSRAARGFGPLRIIAELKQRGIDGAAREAACDPAAREWLERAHQARRKRFGESAPAEFRERARQARFLIQRGFSRSHVSAALGDSLRDRR